MEGNLPNPAQPLDSDWKGSVQAQVSLNARKFPQRLAIVAPLEEWTYQELDSRSNRIADYLSAHGVAPHDIVAVYAHRSAPLVAAVLGILKAGAAFVILDPAYPAARLLDCLRTARPRAWLQMEAAGALPEALEEFAASSSMPCRLEIPRDGSAIERILGKYSADDTTVAVEADDAACIAFTSGSTGRPKGVLGRHGPLSHFLPWQERTFKLEAGDRFSMLSGLSHDPLQRDIFTPLWLGAILCIPDPQIIGTTELSRWMAEERITFAHLTPAMARLLTGTAASDCRMPSLRYAFFVGDKLSRGDVSRLRRLAPKVMCIASYGTTETQRAVGYYPVPPEAELQDNRDNEIYPLGRGIDGVQLLVLTDEKVLAGVGQLGEIYVRSPHLAKGYIADEAVTQARFLTNPFTGMKDDRLYRTGDLGRYLPNGDVVFAGRVDNQVKIRNFRIELGDIEAALGQHPQVRECAVRAAQAMPGEEWLLACVVPSREASPAIPELRNFLRQKLPEHMVPAAFIFLDALPLTPNGKLDREALPAPVRKRSQLESDFVTPRNAAEEELAGVWADVLKLEKVGVKDNFFELGGDSLTAAQIIAKANKAGFKIDVTHILQNQTIAELAAAAAPAEDRASGTESVKNKYPSAGPWSFLIALQAEGSKPPFFWIHGENSNAFLPRFLAPDQPLYGFLHQSRDGKQARYQRIDDMAAQYLKEIRSVQSEGPYFLGGFCVGGTVAFEMAQQLRKQAQEVALLIMVDPNNPRIKRQVSSRLSSRAPSSSQGSNFSIDRLYRYIRKLAEARSAQDKLICILETLKEKSREALAKASKSSRAIAWKIAVSGQNLLQKLAGEIFYLTGIEPIPLSLVNFYLDAIYTRAGRAYKLSFYPGRVIVLSTEDNIFDARKGFAGVVGDRLEVVDINARHDQVMFWEGQIQLVAETVKSYLERAQAEQRR